MSAYFFSCSLLLGNVVLAVGAYYTILIPVSSYYSFETSTSNYHFQYCQSVGTSSFLIDALNTAYTSVNKLLSNLIPNISQIMCFIFPRLRRPHCWGKCSVTKCNSLTWLKKTNKVELLQWIKCGHQ